MATGLAIAPNPPGQLGQAPDPSALLAYLRALRDWVAQRKRELDGIDASASRSSDPDDYVADITLSMTLWQSVNERLQRLDVLWDSGRADAVTREQMAQVIHGRLAAGSGSAISTQLSLSVVEACRLSDALAAQLRNRLSFDPRASDDAMRVQALRASMERLRELVKQESSWGPQVDMLETRLNDVSTRAARGGDVSGVLHDLEVDAARAERDLVVTTATQLKDARGRKAAEAELVSDRSRAASEVAALVNRRARLVELMQRCVAEITPAPRFAVPDVAVLGPVPQDRRGLDVFTQRLDTVVRGMDVVEDAYGAPLAEREELIGLLSSYEAMAIGSRTADDSALRVALGRAQQALAARPTDIAAARLAVTTYRELVRGMAGRDRPVAANGAAPSTALISEAAPLPTGSSVPAFPAAPDPAAPDPAATNTAAPRETTA